MRYTDTDREIALAAYRAGLSFNEAAASLDIPAATIRWWLLQSGGRPRAKERSRLRRIRAGNLYGHVRQHEAEIAARALGVSQSATARAIGASPSGVARYW